MSAGPIIFRLVGLVLRPICSGDAASCDSSPRLTKCKLLTVWIEKLHV